MWSFQNRWIRLKAVLGIIPGMERRLSTIDALHYEKCALNSTLAGVNEKQRKVELVVSLTSHGRRVFHVHSVVESIMQQTVKADKIVLWLSKEEYDEDSLPEVLKFQERRGLIVKFCRDLKSYNKLIHSLKEFPQSLILTVDDDVLYPIFHIERLYKAWLKNSDIIHCYRAHRMGYDAKQKPLAYAKWEQEIEPGCAGMDVFPTGVGGVLYFPGCFDNEVFNERIFLRLCPKADDVWFKFMSMKQGVHCKVVPYFNRVEFYRVLPGPGEESLGHHNVLRRRNDAQIRDVYEYLAHNLSER